MTRSSYKPSQGWPVYGTWRAGFPMPFVAPSNVAGGTRDGNMVAAGRSEPSGKLMPRLPLLALLLLLLPIREVS
ncbi:hypothetical protein EON62_01455 [archaeon]|nr:MAG: hypothetical protein EON62_01455 [archaeon]